MLIVLFLNCFLGASRPTLDHSQGDSLTSPMLITAFELFRPEGHREPRNEVESLSPAKRLLGFEPETFRFLTHYQSVYTLKVYKTESYAPTKTIRTTYIKTLKLEN